MDWSSFLARMFRFRLATVATVATALAVAVVVARWSATHYFDQLTSIFLVALLLYVVAAVVLLAKGLILGSVTAGERGVRQASMGMWMILTLPMLAACAYAVSMPRSEGTGTPWRPFESAASASDSPT